MAPELLQDPRERSAGSTGDAAQSPDTDGRGEQSASIQDEQRLLEPGSGPAPEHGPEPDQFQPELAGAPELDTGPLALAAEQLQPEPRHHPRSSGLAELAANPTAATSNPATAATRSVQPIFEQSAAEQPAESEPESEPEQCAAATATAAATTAEQRESAAADGQSELAHPGSDSGSRSGSGFSATAAVSTNAAATAAAAATVVQRAELAGPDGQEVCR